MKNLQKIKTEEIQGFSAFVMSSMIHVSDDATSNYFRFGASVEAKLRKKK